MKFRHFGHFRFEKMLLLLHFLDFELDLLVRAIRSLGFFGEWSLFRLSRWSKNIDVSKCLKGVSNPFFVIVRNFKSWFYSFCDRQNLNISNDQLAKTLYKNTKKWIQFKNLLSNMKAKISRSNTFAIFFYCQKFFKFVLSLLNKRCYIKI